jgi:hypothetical protein
MDNRQYQSSRLLDQIPQAESEHYKGDKNMPLNGVYKDVLDRIALQQLIVPAYIPNPNLGVDINEETQPYNLSYSRMTANRRQTVVLPDPTQIPIEEMAANFQGNPVNVSDFPAGFYVGNPIM